MFRRAWLAALLSTLISLVSGLHLAFVIGHPLSAAMSFGTAGLSLLVVTIAYRRRHEEV